MKIKDRLSIFCPIRIVIIGEKDPRTVVVKYVDVTDNRYPKYLQKLMYNHCLRFVFVCETIPVSLNVECCLSMPSFCLSLKIKDCFPNDFGNDDLIT